MPGKSTTAPKTNLYPRITGTMTCKWDVGSKGKVFLHTTDGAISLLGYSAVVQVLKFDYKVFGQVLQCAKNAVSMIPFNLYP